MAFFLPFAPGRTVRFEGAGSKDDGGSRNYRYLTRQRETRTQPTPRIPRPRSRPRDTGGRDSAPPGSDGCLVTAGRRESCGLPEPARTNRGASPAASPRFTLYPQNRSCENDTRETHPGEVPVKIKIIIAKKKKKKGRERQAAAFAPARSGRRRTRAGGASRGRPPHRSAPPLRPPTPATTTALRETRRSGAFRSVPGTRRLSAGPGTGTRPAAGTARRRGGGRGNAGQRRRCPPSGCPPGAVGLGWTVAPPSQGPLPTPLLPVPSRRCWAVPHICAGRGAPLTPMATAGRMEEPERRPPPPPPDAPSPAAASSATVWRAAGGGAQARARPHSRTDARRGLRPAPTTRRAAARRQSEAGSAAGTQPPTANPGSARPALAPRGSARSERSRREGEGGLPPHLQRDAPAGGGWPLYFA